MTVAQKMSTTAHFCAIEVSPVGKRLINRQFSNSFSLFSSFLYLKLTAKNV